MCIFAGRIGWVMAETPAVLAERALRVVLGEVAVARRTLAAHAVACSGLGFEL
jgi:hypothetical protein